MLSASLKSIVVLSVLSLIACSGPKSSTMETTNSDGIIGGQPVAAKAEISKSIVGIYDAGVGAICTGSLLPGNIVLTAAHCIGPDATQMFIVFSNDMISTLQSQDPTVLRKVLRRVSSAKVNEGWDPKSHDTQDLDWHDIALIKFSGSVPADFQPATLLADAAELKKDAKVTLAGYGVDKIAVNEVDPANYPNLEDSIAKQELFCSPDRKQCISVQSSGSGLLRSVEVAIANVNATEVALDQHQGQGACSGDSGGPAYVQKNGKFYLWGITSRGTVGCGEEALYTNALVYLDWINKTAPGLK